MTSSINVECWLMDQSQCVGRHMLWVLSSTINLSSIKNYWEKCKEGMKFVNKSEMFKSIVYMLNKLIGLHNSAAKGIQGWMLEKKERKKKTIIYWTCITDGSTYIASIIYSLQQPSEMLISTKANRTEVTKSFQVHNASTCWNKNMDNGLYWYSPKALVLNYCTIFRL